MDLALLITEAACEQFKKDCLDHTYVLTVSKHGGRYKCDIQVVPMTNHVLLKYKSLEFKLSKHESAEYMDAIEFLMNGIDNDISYALEEDIEFNGYWPADDEYYHENFIHVKRNEDIHFRKRVADDDVIKVAMTYLKNMRFVV